jgi:polyhydroxyalkanoate synthase
MWLASVFEQFDQQRRACRCLLGAWGIGGPATPSRVVLSSSGFVLREYEGGSRKSPVLLAIPAPIKNADVWNLAPWASVVQRCQQAHIRVYLIEWSPPRADQTHFGLSHYAHRAIDDCLTAITARTANRRVLLAGHSLGGTLTAIYAALHPERVAALVLLAAPLNFGPQIGAFAAASAIASTAATRIVEDGNVPGSMLSASSIAADPVTFGWERWLDWLCCPADLQSIHTNLRVERWALAETPVARHLFEEVVESLYRENRLMRGTLRCDGRRVAPEMVQAPLLCVVDRRCRVVPPQAVLPFVAAAGSSEKRILWHSRETGLCFQHVGVLVGAGAHRYLWPAILHWLQAQWRP